MAKRYKAPKAKFSKPPESQPEKPKVPKPIGELRRSTVASTFGPGAIADFRTPSGAPVSVVMAGLDEWAAYSGGSDDRAQDARLERLLGVEWFRLPPVARSRDDTDAKRLPAVRFPQWLQCPQCHTIDHYSKWTGDLAIADRWCPECTGAGGKDSRVFAVPVRFILACEHGHIEDFPWKWWAQHTPNCKDASKLRLVSDGAGLAGLKLECCSCHQKRAMDKAFDRKVLEQLRCSGERPWLRGGKEDCESSVRVLQRGASNLYFPVVQSSLLIPPWDDDVLERLGDSWADLLELETAERLPWIRKRIEKGRITIPPDWDEELFAQKVAALAAKQEGIDTGNIRGEEWEQIVFADFGGAPPTRDFQVHRENVPAGLHPHVAHLVRVVRLRELRALKGFTRINPPPTVEDTGDVKIAAMSAKQYPWLPAVEVRGEGVFVSLDESRLLVWEHLSGVQSRTARLNSARREEHASRYGKDAKPLEDFAPRHLLVHALAHALMRQLSLECGYSTASLRERLYSGTGRAGVLIYTATTDADGTLGGLQRQGEAKRIEMTLRDAIRAQRWCSSDPLCIRDLMMVSNASNLAACHACLLAPETSCEHFNQFLDRALLVGTPEDPTIGFFEEWLSK